MFQKTKAILRTEFERQLTYRFNFFAYRFSSVVHILAQIVIWTAIYRGTNIPVQGYTYEEMMTYILIGWFFGYFSANYVFERVVSTHIMRGELSMFMLKPMQYIYYIVVLSVGRISIALGSALFIQLLFTSLFYPVLIVSFNLPRLLLVASLLIVGYFLKMAISIILGFLSFWLTEVDGVHNLIRTCMDFLSGSLFPLTLLSGVVGAGILYNPLAYTFFVPIQIYLGKMSLYDGIVGLGVELGWLAVFSFIVWILWRKGLRKYEGVGI